jgi:hypothetical protein
MFSQVLDKFSSWFGHTFLLARFFPWLLFAVANVGLTYLAFPSSRGFIDGDIAGIASGAKLVDSLIIFGAIGVIAYATSPAVRFITELLEGEILPVWMTRPLLLRESYRADQGNKRRIKIFEARANLPSLDEIVSTLAEAKKTGAGLGRALDAKSIEESLSRILVLRMRKSLNHPIQRQELLDAVEWLAAAMRLNCSEPNRLKTYVEGQERDLATRLNNLHREFVENLAPYAKEIAGKREDRQIANAEKRFATAYASPTPVIFDIAPTYLGNEAAALRAYCKSRYGMDFEFFWPRLELALRNDDKMNAALTNARIQLEFSILSFILSGLFFVGWLLILLGVGRSALAIVLVAGLTQPVTALWLWIVHQSYAALAEVMRAVVDVSRFELLKALHQPLPRTLDAERRLWERLELQLIANEHRYDLTFLHPSP